MNRVITPGNWGQSAACQYTDPELFFPEAADGDAVPVGRSDPAHRVCLGCPVRRHCLARALRDGEPFGMWGGVPEREIRAELRSPTGRTVPQIIEDADRRYFKRQDRVTGHNDRRLAAYYDSRPATQAA